MSRTLSRLLLAGGLLGILGCDGNSKPNTKPMTEEEIRQMKEQDRQIDEDERGGSGTATGKPKRK
ncbi:MAG TPA: hypothetical protein VKE40_21270 [Gemmataceae bacterium]|nr:hypothetical protein [Gemmataceae bacterium]